MHMPPRKQVTKEPVSQINFPDYFISRLLLFTTKEMEALQHTTK